MSCHASELFSVQGKVVVITGGGTGIGRMLAEGFVENGAKVYIIGRRKEVLDKTVNEITQEYGSEGGSIHAIQGDVSTKDGVHSIVTSLSSTETKVDVLINNAAIQKPWRTQITDHRDGGLHVHAEDCHADADAADQVEKLVWEGVEDEDWNTTNQVNVNGPYFMTAGLVPLLRKSDDPSVVVIASIAAIANQRPVSTLTYGVSKAAAVHLTTMLAGRLSPLKIRVNAILPGTFPTDITARINDAGDQELLPAVKKVVMRTPLSRAGTKEEILGPVLMLSSQAGRYMTNAVISVDGGRSMNAGIDDGIRLPDGYYH